MKGSKTANRYAQALLDLAIERNVLEVVAGDMKFLSIVCAENHDFELMLASPIVRADKKIAVLKAVFTHFDALSTQFIELIAKNGREAILPEIAIAFEAQLNAHKGILPVTITSATKLDDSVRKSILEKIQQHFSGTFAVTEEVDETLIGGFIVKMDDQMIDASVASQLTQLKQRLTK